MRKIIIASVLFLSAFGLAQNQVPVPHGTDGTLTRSASRYKALETALLQAQQEKQQDKVSGMLADDFEVWSSEQSDPTPRELWEQNAASSNISWFQIRNMAVRDFGNIAIVSFLLDRHGEANGKPVTPTVFIVDVWQQPAGKLAVRYQSVPGKPGAQLLPTGKE